MSLIFLHAYSPVGPHALDDRRQRALAAYLGLAIGDALGATTEFLTPSEIRHRHGLHRDLVGGGWLGLKPGAVTDDTQMSLALGRSILEQGGVVPGAVAEAFSTWMRSKPVDIGHTVRRGIVQFRRTGEPHLAVDERNAGNGACMRCLPVALLHCDSQEQALVRASRDQAHVTHNSKVADAGTETVLRMLVAALRGKSVTALTEHALRLVAQYPAYAFDRRPVTNPSGWIVDTLKVVFQSLFAHTSFEDTLVDVVNRGGDSDTTGAIAGMLAGALYGLKAIPARWMRALDPAVSQDCRSQALQLLELAAAH